MELELKRINDFFGQAVNVVLDRPFALKPSSSLCFAQGEITLCRLRENYSFRVDVPTNFPLSGLQFYYLGNQVARHLLRGGLVCLNSSFTDSFDQKLKLDLDAIGEWIDVYCISKHKQHYEYLPIERRALFMLFDEPIAPVRLNSRDSGTFHYMELPCGNEMPQETFIVLDIGALSGQWSAHYRLVSTQKAVEYWKQMLFTWTLLRQVTNEQALAFADLVSGKPWPSNVPELLLPSFVVENARSMAKGSKGLYYFMDREPLNSQGEIIRTIGELNNLLTPEVREQIRQNQQALKPKAGVPFTAAGQKEFFFFMLGYPIPEQEQIHWELILYPVQQATGTGKERRVANQLTWGKTVNASYERFFGRGRLADAISLGKILVLGLGAMGSSLCQALVRGGAKHLAISDFDDVEAGNICRSTYNFDQIHRSKAMSLMEQLIYMSPFVTVTPIVPFLPEFAEESESVGGLRAVMNAFTLIIDCTANDSVAWMLDQMQLDATVINLSISDEAKHLVAVTNTGKEAILPVKRQIFAALGQAETTATFYEGAGCWHPTFRASFADINLLLQQYIADANHRLTLGKSWVTTVLETVKGDFGLRVVKREDVA